MLTCGIDKQESHYVFCVDAWHPDGSCRTIDYGTTEDLDEMKREVLLRKYDHEDDGPALKVSCVLIDSGYKPAGVYEFARDCRKEGINVLPCKGSSTALNASYRKSKLGKETAMPGSPIVHVDTLTSQDWLEKQLGTLTKDTPGGWSLFYGTLLEHQDILEQLLNDAPVHKLDASNNTRISFERLDTASPNDLRDCRRYAWIARLVRQRGAPIRSRRVATPEEKRDAEKAREKTRAKRQPNRLDAFKRPGGWLGRR
jgi:phage terminase large subunit GpA-like protein